MSLPKVSQPIFSVTVKELGKTLKFRPFLMKEERAILVAKSIGDEDSIRNTIEEVVQACLVSSKENIQVSELPAHIVDYLYINIYVKSNSDRLPVEYTCRHSILKTTKVPYVTDDGVESEKEEEIYEECGHKTSNTLNLANVEIRYPEGYEERKKIEVGPGITLNVEYPKSRSIRIINKMNQYDEETGEFINSQEDREKAYQDLIMESIVNITEIKDGEEFVKLPNTDFNADEFFEWIDTLPKEVSTKLSLFFAELPSISLVENMMCLNPECLQKTEYEIVGAKSFFLLS